MYLCTVKNKKTMRTYCQDWKVEDKNDINVLSQLVLSNLKKGENFKIGNTIYDVVTQTKNTLKIRSNKKNYSFKINVLMEYGIWCCNIGRGYDSANQILRDIEGDLILDMLNSNNPFHELTDAEKILRRDPIYN